MSDYTSDRPDLRTALRDALPTHEAPATLVDWALREAREYDEELHRTARDSTDRRHSRTFSIAGWRIAAGLICAAALGWGGATVFARRQTTSASAQTVDALIDTHVRSLLPGHLIDVQSSDRHTVKPWFAGRIDISPPVVDLAPQGFPLVGGRLDYIQGHPAAALIYGRRLHMINLFVWRTAPGEPAQESTEIRGYSILHWTAGDLSYWAVSDAAPAELDAFRDAYTKEVSSAPQR